MKVCPKCGVRLDVRSFKRDRTRGDGRQCYCLLCIAEQWQGWYQRNKKKAIKRVSLWKAANRERVNASSSKWRRRHPMASRAAFKRWYQRYPEKQRARKEQYAKSHH